MSAFSCCRLDASWLCKSEVSKLGTDPVESVICLLLTPSNSFNWSISLCRESPSSEHTQFPGRNHCRKIRSSSSRLILTTTLRFGEKTTFNGYIKGNNVKAVLGVDIYNLKKYTCKQYTLNHIYRSFHCRQCLYAVFIEKCLYRGKLRRIEHQIPKYPVGTSYLIRIIHHL